MEFTDTGSGKHRRLVNVSDLAESLGKSYCAALLGLYVFTGEDCTSSFKGKGKVTPLKKLEKNHKFQEAFQCLGDSWVIEEDIIKKLEHFNCLMYGQCRESSVDAIQLKMLRKMVGEDERLTSKSKIDLGRLPPCYSALKPHIQRVNHRVALYKRAVQAIIEKPKPFEQDQGWTIIDDGILEPNWCCGKVLPAVLRYELLHIGGHFLGNVMYALARQLTKYNTNHTSRCFIIDLGKPKQPSSPFYRKRTRDL